MSALPPRSAPSSVPIRDNGRKPRTLADRLWLGVILLLLPAAAVCIPTVVISHIFGQRPPPKVPPVETTALQQSLELSASQLLPTPPPLGPDAISVTVRADHLAARMIKISEQAQEFGGSASEGLSTATEKRLSVALPAGRADAFRQAVKVNAAPGSISPSPSVGPTPAGKDFVDVVIRAVGDDE